MNEKIFETTTQSFQFSEIVFVWGVCFRSSLMEKYSKFPILVDPATVSFYGNSIGAPHEKLDPAIRE